MNKIFIAISSITLLCLYISFIALEKWKRVDSIPHIAPDNINDSINLLQYSIDYLDVPIRYYAFIAHKQLSTPI